MLLLAVRAVLTSHTGPCVARPLDDFPQGPGVAAIDNRRTQLDIGIWTAPTNYHPGPAGMDYPSRRASRRWNNERPTRAAAQRPGFYNNASGAGWPYADGGVARCGPIIRRTERPGRPTNQPGQVVPQSISSMRRTGLEKFRPGRRRARVDDRDIRQANQAESSSARPGSFSKSDARNLDCSHGLVAQPSAQ